MSPHYPVLSGQQMMAVLKKVGFSKSSQHGSHVKLRGPDGRTAIVPMHKELAQGTVRSIVRQAGLTDDEFRAWLD